MSAFTVTITANVAAEGETPERGTFATQQFDTVAAAEKYAAAESHGVDGALWEITANLSVKKACSLIMASRNRNICLYVQTRPSDANGNVLEPIGGYLQLKAPGTCEALAKMYARCSEDVLVHVCINAYALYVG